MAQNRNKLIDLFIGNISNCIIHKILEKAIDEENIRCYYGKEMSASLEIAKRYREKINPNYTSLPEKDISDIRQRIIKKVSSELMLRIEKGYKNIDLSLIEPTVEEFLEETRVR